MKRRFFGIFLSLVFFMSCFVDPFNSLRISGNKVNRLLNKIFADQIPKKGRQIQKMSSLCKKNAIKPVKYTGFQKKSENLATPAIACRI